MLQFIPDVVEQACREMASSRGSALDNRSRCDERGDSGKVDLTGLKPTAAEAERPLS